MVYGILNYILLFQAYDYFIAWFFHSIRLSWLYFVANIPTNSPQLQLIPFYHILDYVLSHIAIASNPYFSHSYQWNPSPYITITLRRIAVQFTNCFCKLLLSQKLSHQILVHFCFTFRRFVISSHYQNYHCCAFLDWSFHCASKSIWQFGPQMNEAKVITKKAILENLANNQ